MNMEQEFGEFSLEGIGNAKGAFGGDFGVKFYTLSLRLVPYKEVLTEPINEYGLKVIIQKRGC